MQPTVLSYKIHTVAPYINWIYFFHAWGFQPRAYSRHVPYHDKRQNSPVQLQAGRGGEVVERGVRPRVRSQCGGTGGQPYAGSARQGLRSKDNLQAL